MTIPPCVQRLLTAAVLLPAMPCMLFAEATPDAAPAGSKPVEYLLDQSNTVQTLEQAGVQVSERVQKVGEGRWADRWVFEASHATLTVYQPEGTPRAAAVVCPGGGYGMLSFDKEGVAMARWLCERGVAAGVLKYATASNDQDRPLLGKPLSQAQQAVKLLKHRFGVPVGVIGFSAGGHLAASAANRVAGPTKGPAGGLAEQDSRVAFQALVYPVISMAPGVTHGGSRTNLLGASPSDESVRAWSMENAVTADTPPAFLVATADDRAVPAENSIRYFQACQRAGVPAELHIYPEGGHGYGMWRTEGTIAGWPAAFEAWLQTVLPSE
ncbi:MAG: alpha/beta hydrolase [Planctomycetota bacterium]